MKDKLSAKNYIGYTICDSANKALGLSSGTGSSSLESRESSGTWGDGSWN